MAAATASRRLIEESERLLRASHYLYDVSIRPTSYSDGVVDIEVRTRDTWSFEPGASFSRGGGSNSGGASVKEKNLLGTGVTLGLSQSSSVDRKGYEVEIAHHQVFGGRASVAYKQSDLSDGSSKEFSLTRPFYALDARWGRWRVGGAVRPCRLGVQQWRNHPPIPPSATIVASIRRLVEGLGRRLDPALLGRRRLRGRQVPPEPGAVAPTPLPTDQTLIYPFVLYEVLEDRTKSQESRQGRAPRVLQHGIQLARELGRAIEASLDARLWLYSGAIGKGVRLAPNADLLAAMSFSASMPRA